ncbi:MAG: hypothetical protein AMJ45_00775 [Syntrophobacter sp. DG_60]|nr:MAG: hypothetical protein AMJ45_00775 [Syntrophobacter sp. DG_60]
MPFKIALISMPWPASYRPSIQLGALKAFLNLQKIQVDTFHFYPEVADAIGINVYETISSSTWLSEAIYASLLFPEREGMIQGFLEKERKKRKKKLSIRLAEITEKIKRLHKRHLRGIKWEKYQLIGSSICISQLTSSLYMIKKIKGLCPKIPIIIGGSGVCGEIGKSLLKLFPEIDFVIQGEGELPLWRLCKSLKSKSDFDIPGLMRRFNEQVTGDGYQQIQNLDYLPPPDYTDYFNTLKNSKSSKSVITAIPIEGSRGCWWNQSHRGKPLKACRFCNLNLQWKGYRAKTPSRIVKEVDYLVRKYRSLRLYFVDNILNYEGIKETFEGIANLGRDLEIFLESRAQIRKEQLKWMRRAGVKEIQIGIEALSTSLLKKMHKGTTAIQNIAIMKHCEEFGIMNSANLITCFPGSEEREVTETLKNIDFVLPYRPLKGIKFWLGYGSAIASYPKMFNIRRIYNHRVYSILFPEFFYKKLYFMDKGYVGNRNKQERVWRPVLKRCRQWQDYYKKMKSLSCDHILSYMDGGDFLIVRHRLNEGQNELHRLRGVSREIYLFCDTIKHFKKISERFRSISQEKLLSFLNSLVDKKIMFKEGNRFLSLAVKEKLQNG